MTIKELIQKLHIQVPCFAKVILDCKYSTYLSYVALKTLELLGNENSNKTLSYEGEEYYFEIRKKSLTIKQKIRGQILRETEDSFDCNFTLQDIEKIEAFEQKLDKKFQESIRKN